MLYECLFVGFGLVYLGVAIMLAIHFEDYHNDPRFFYTCGSITILGIAFIIISIGMFLAHFLF